MLITTIVIWAFNVTVTKYVLTHGFRPLAYASLRYAAAALLAVVRRARARALAARRRPADAGPARRSRPSFLLVNQLSLRLRAEADDARRRSSLIIGTTPIFTAMIASRRSGSSGSRGGSGSRPRSAFGGVALVALGSGGGLSADLGGDLLARRRSPPPGPAYSVTIAPLMRPYSPYRISAVVLLRDGRPAPRDQLPQLGRAGLRTLEPRSSGSASRSRSSGRSSLTNLLWFTAIHRVGPSRATLFANLQPFLARGLRAASCSPST